MSIAISNRNESIAPSIHDVQATFPPLEALIEEVTQTIAPVWPLKDYVAVNPYAGMSQSSFMDARAFMKVFSDCELLMPIEHYAAEFNRGEFSTRDIDEAIAELSANAIQLPISTAQIAENLRALGPVGSTLDQPAATPNPDRPIRSVAENATARHGVDWSEAIVDEISKHCSAYYDQGQATWASPFRDMPLFEAWKSAAEHDCNIEILGLKGFRAFVVGLPKTPETTIRHLLQQLEIPRAMWSKFLLCQAFSIPGWCAWAKYQTSWTNAAEPKNDLTALLAIRLAYDAALASVLALKLDWTSLELHDPAYFDAPSTVPSHGSEIASSLRYTLLRASEIGYRNRLLESLAITNDAQSSTEPARKLAQIVFCIDVRSERIRRQLESRSLDVETFGFAGFFGMSFDYVTLGQTSGNSQLPVLLKPQFEVHEGFHERAGNAASDDENAAKEKVVQYRSWSSLWKSFQTSAVGCFSFVETTGLWYGARLFQRALGMTAFDASSLEGLSKDVREKLGPTRRGLHEQGVSTSQQADMAEAMLRNLGLTKNFAKLVVFCGHACQTENNPLAAGLDCGACGGHSGEPNARFAALLCNESAIRELLSNRGIEIPADTHFLGGLHNTTTDAIKLFDVDRVPTGHESALQELMSTCAMATKQTRTERLPVVASKTLHDLLRRAGDWSEVRPEWGLAGNAAFIVAPRALTMNANLDGRTFLHSYDFTQDDGGKVLETIMTAPMIVANWINMQYYASTVDNHHFGSGNKTVHNVVGKFGVLSGNSGDLMTGLPWQSLHTGEAYQHLPLRLQVVIAAPRAMIERVINKHEMVANLICGAWLHLVAIDEGQSYRYNEQGKWERVEFE